MNTPTVPPDLADLSSDDRLDALRRLLNGDGCAVTVTSQKLIRRRCMKSGQ